MASIFPGPVPENSLPQSPIDRANIEHVLKHGYVVLEDVFTKENAEEAKSEMRRLSGEQAKKGRNPFEGLDTIRVYSLLNKYAYKLLKCQDVDHAAGADPSTSTAYSRKSSRSTTSSSLQATRSLCSIASRSTLLKPPNLFTTTMRTVIFHGPVRLSVLPP